MRITDMVIEKEEIDAALDEIFAGGEVVEVRLGRQPKPFNCSLVEINKEGSGHLLVSPLEPAIGNMQIRREKNEIRIGFYLGQQFIESKTAFLGLQDVPDRGRCIQLRYPRVLTPSTVREEKRSGIPEELAMQVYIQKKGETGGFLGQLLDLSSGGLSVCDCENTRDDLAEGDQVRLKLVATSLIGEPLDAIGLIRYHVRMRNKDNLDRVETRYGIQFKMLGPAESVRLDRLLKLLTRMAK